MSVQLEPMTREVREPVVDIFNHYIANSFAAYPDRKMPYEAFDMLQKMSDGYPTVVAKDETGSVVGFGLLRPYNPFPTFSATAEITYFVKAGYTNKGLGGLMLEDLMKKAKAKGISAILANISSLNDSSINFHKKNGFVECGRFQKIGKKNGQIFDVVWMQKML